LAIFWTIAIFSSRLYPPLPNHSLLNSETPSEELRYLTAEQTLADIPHFARSFNRPNFPNVDLRPNSTPWILVSTSYSGVRAACVRNICLEAMSAAYTSSADLEVRTDNSANVEEVYRALNALGIENCTQDIIAAISFIDDAMSDPQSSAQLKETLLGSIGRNQSNGSFGEAWPR
jgi:Serine carboxypeptidase S28